MPFVNRENRLVQRKRTHSMLATVTGKRCLGPCFEQLEERTLLTTSNISSILPTPSTVPVDAILISSSEEVTAFDTNDSSLNQRAMAPTALAGELPKKSPPDVDDAPLGNSSSIAPTVDVPRPSAAHTGDPNDGRVTNQDSTQMFPRWHPYVMVDPVDLSGGILSQLTEARVAIDTRNAVHVAGSFLPVTFPSPL